MERIEWREIADAPGYYISNEGQVWSPNLQDVMKQFNVRGYRVLKLPTRGIFKQRYIHRLVAEAFLPGPKKATVNHKDGVKHHNTVDNLEWATYGENNQHALNNSLRTPSGGVPPRPIRIRETGQEFKSINECCRQTGFNKGSLNDCLSGRRRSHRGYTFEYVS